MNSTRRLGGAKSLFFGPLETATSLPLSGRAPHPRVRFAFPPFPARMERYLFAFTWKTLPDPAKAPAERAQAQHLLAGPHLEQVLLATDRSRGWLVVRAPTEQAAAAVLATLPFFPHMQLAVKPLEIHYP
ncbi:muconolactone Delta-isomerase family protein [Hymenobacter lapidiphilus]|uniref:Muconolactone isomerase domain-containing protein n=1 Tax=Hymenobacter lapidiphilus TaxID=2608003 RepID=A0A7Y7PR07_9BACT|nr:muconolactone Delta-isomerase family protein [Hymenobacter lapidiphilus]NVO32254.1 hypothetical protein [Hymenobacter lapidiphilus]